MADMTTTPPAAPVGGSPAPDATPATAGVLAQVMITAKEDGSFDVQPMADGQPTGDPVPVDSIDTAMQSAQDALNPVGGGEGDAGAAPAEGTPVEGAGDATGASPDEAALADDKAKYAQKRGTRPKTAPSWADYANGGNPTAQ